MQVNKILVNNLESPFGFSFNEIQVNIQFVNTVETEKYNIKLLENNNLVYEKKAINVLENIIDIDYQTKSRSEYIVEISGTNGKVYTTTFESGKGEEAFIAKWIAGNKLVQNNIFKYDFKSNGEIEKARLYMSCQGVYQAKFNNILVSDEVLAPGFTKYDSYTQVQTYDVTNLLKSDNNIEVSVGDGWFKGSLGFEEGEENIYGDTQAIIVELHIDYTNGETEVIATNEDWKVYSGQTTKSAIYYGQDIDLTKELEFVGNVEVIQGVPIIDRLSVPVKVQEQFAVKELITTPKGEMVLDFGQNHSGWIKFFNTTPKGEKLVFEFGEILQEGNFYRGNLREARARFEVISDGVEKWINPSFTFFGYRYVKVTGIENIDVNNFISQAIYSDIDFHSSLKTNNQKVNQLFSNVLWGQKSNFIDIPTDCPQRNERLGWTGDANVFAKTAGINANVVQFYKKYMKDVRVEQNLLNGKIPMYAPAIGHTDGGAAVWADVVTMLPWNVYLQTGDTQILKDNYTAMKDWLGWVSEQTEENKNKFIWSNSFQFGDWLALDGSNPAIPSGGTGESFIATVYYYMSADITAKVGEIIGDENYKQYEKLAENIKQAILDEYITTSGKMTLNTQAGYALMLMSGIVSGMQKERVLNDFIYRLNCDKNLIQTGFVGTPMLCPSLSANGYHKLATKIFLHEEYPSWLYAVNLGATTIWERWNSVMPDGTMNPEGMNSLNHYSYGAIKEWAYEYLLGVKNTSVGYKEVSIKPGITNMLSEISGNIASPNGEIKFSWKLEGNIVKAELTIPLGTTAVFDTSDVIDNTFKVDGKEHPGKFVCGLYSIEYVVKDEVIKDEVLNLDSSLFDIANNPKVWNQVCDLKPQLRFFEDKSARAKFGRSTLIQVAKNLPFINFSEKELEQIKEILCN